MKIAGKYPNIRLRRVRNSPWMRKLVSENNLSINDLILPIFIRDGKNKIEGIKSMPGVNRYSVDKLHLIMNKAQKYKIPMVALFPYTKKNKKDKFGTEALNANNLVCKSLKFIKKRYSGIGVMCDVALDPYTSHGHDGIIINKKIDYDLYPDLLQQLGIDKPLGNKKLFIRYGGPVESGRGFILHSDEIMQKDTLSIEKGVALTSTAEFFEDLSEGKGPRNSILALGYAGWSPGQLENEILSNSWMTLQTDSSFLFDDEASERKDTEGRVQFH